MHKEKSIWDCGVLNIVHVRGIGPLPIRIAQPSAMGSEGSVGVDIKHSGRNLKTGWGGREGLGGLG